MLEHRAGNLDRARELFQQGVWAQPRGRDVATVWQVRPSLLPLLRPPHGLHAGQSGWPHERSDGPPRAAWWRERSV